MSTPAKKVKRRVVPTHIVEDMILVTPKKKLDSQWSTHYQKHYNSLLEKGAVDKIRKRAVEMGYEKERKARPVTAKRKDDEDDAHGSHHEHLSSFSEYVKHFSSMKTHSKGVTLLDYLRKNFDKHMYFSSKTKRFRKSKL